MITKTVLSSAKNAILVSLLGVSSFVVSEQVVVAQSTGHGSHHHLMLGWDNSQILTRGDYAGLANPNYGRLSLLFPHQHEPIESSGFHAIGAYSYTGLVSNPTVIPTSTNNHIPETRANFPLIPLFPDNGVFAGKWVSQATEENIYSDLKTRPVHHLLEDIDEPYVTAIYNSGNGRWNSLLGDEATIALELISIIPGLKVADAQGNELFTSGNTVQVIGQGDDFAFTPKFFVDETAPIASYSATLRFLDVNDNGRTPFLSSGTFTLDFRQSKIPEPSTLLGIGMIGLFFLRSRQRQD